MQTIRLLVYQKKKKKKNYKIATDRLTNMIHELAKAEEMAEFEN